MANLIRVALCISNFRQGGAETQFWYLARGLDRSKYKVHIIQLAYHQDAPEPIGLPEGTEVLTIRRNRRADINCVIQLARYLRRNKIQIIQSMLFMDNQFARLSGVLAGVRVVSSIRGEIGPLLGRKKTWFEYRMQMLSACITTNSNWLRDYLIANGSRADKVVTIYNGVDIDKFRVAEDSGKTRKKYGLPDDAIVIGIVARLHPMKDHITFIDVIDRIRKKVPGVRAVIIGDGEIRGHLESYVRGLMLEKIITFTGSIKKDIATTYHILDVLLLTSQYGESFPNVILEAMSAGVPVVASNVSAVPEFVVDGENGCLVDKGDVDQFVEKTINIITNSEVRNHLVEKAALTIENYRVSKMTQNYGALYERIASR